MLLSVVPLYGMGSLPVMNKVKVVTPAHAMEEYLEVKCTCTYFSLGTGRA